MAQFPLERQFDEKDCGPACLCMISRYYGKTFSLEMLRHLTGTNREGASLLDLSGAAEKVGFRSAPALINLDELADYQLPMVLHWNRNHFVVLYKISRRKKRIYHIADPAKGLVKFSENDFISYWKYTEDNEGIILSLSPTPDFYTQEEDKINKNKISYVVNYLKGYSRLIIQLFIGLGLGSLLQLAVPFLTQSIVDIGINTHDLDFIYIILLAQIMLFIGRLSLDFIRSWILLHISSRVSIAILTDFIIKLMKLPASFFETRMTGDILQRMNDQRRIQSFLTGPALNVSFSTFSLLIFSIVLIYYSINIFLVFSVTTVLYLLWVFGYLKKRKDLDYRRFDVSSQNQSSIMQLVSGINEIKLNNCEKQKRWEWEGLQVKLFRLNIKDLSYAQIQQAGTFFLNEGKNILITFLTAKAVIDGDLTLGSMLAIQYIVGQINGPVEQMLDFFIQFQDAKISFDRLSEIQEMQDEEIAGKFYLNDLPSDKSITLKEVTFSYPGNEPVLLNLSIFIPQNKTTAIVGMSGSGKTTLLKLLLRFYDPVHGDIRIGNGYLNQIGQQFWRGRCGAVMQDGFIFSDTILKNIALNDYYPDLARLNYAVKVANLSEFIESLPLGYHTKIGGEGNGLSQGQKQRILIARAVYKNPDYIFFDEATNALDAHNEKVIMENLEGFLRGKTVVIVAHRLSTVKNADNIIVLNHGKVVEQGNHLELTRLEGEYYNLVKNQLELGN
ncbi:peptidase domain-containing ABC transporter [Olivibacter jilunii]|uniref:peptidase domain-containing ABC transporter n=1 Tax=Olivibacter jilunii TaxID=985016 RepID=UPI003F140BD8